MGAAYAGQDVSTCFDEVELRLSLECAAASMSLCTMSALLAAANAASRAKLCMDCATCWKVESCSLPLMDKDTL